MRVGGRSFLIAILLAGIFTLAVPRAHAYRPLQACTATTTPHRVDTGQSATYTISVTNTDSVPIDWIRLLAPSSSYYILDATAEGWFVSHNSEEVLLLSGQIAPGQTLNYTVSVSTGIIKTPVEYWSIMASSTEGDEFATCTGDTSAAIGLLGPPAIANINAHSITSTSAVIFWTTDQPANSRVDYGPTTAYGQSVNSAGLGTSHSLQITGLKPSTGYHFRITSATEQAVGSSGDSTFVTVAPPAPPRPTVIVAPTSTPDTAPPAITLTNTFPKPQATVPAMTGAASDNTGVTTVEYSINGGNDWIAVDQLTPAAGSRQVSFQFTPVLTTDGDYQISVRAADAAGNRTATTPRSLTIDRLPPRFGAATLSLGPQTILPDPSGIINLSAGIDHRIHINLVGGPTSVVLTARPSAGAASQAFALSQDPESGLWAGLISLNRAGLYELTGAAVDGAGNRTERVVARLSVVPPIYVTTTKPAKLQATATVYYLTKATHTWSVWDGSALGQPNPTPLGAHNSLQFTLPPGTYYLAITSPHGSTVTREFTLSQITPLSGAITFNPPSLKLGPITLNLPWPSLASAPLRAATSAADPPPKLTLPITALPTTSGSSVTPAAWYSRPTVIASLATWSPASTEQLPALRQLSANRDINVVTYIGQQPTQTVKAYQQITAFTSDIVADPDGLLSGALSAPAVPVLYYFDRHGALKRIHYGAQSADDILTQLSQL